jgi:hypothetical protein
MAVGRVMQELLPSLHRVNEDFEHRPSAAGSGIVDLKQVLIETFHYNTLMSKKEINLETSQICWHELQRFFAGGLAIHVYSGLDLVNVAYQFSVDNKSQVEDWIKEHKISAVSDQQALKWFENNAILWAVVVKPWVLVQENTNE